MPTYRTPGVYVQEISTLPPSVAEVATAVPAFIGYTEVGPTDPAKPLVLRIATMLEFETAFGGPQPSGFNVTVRVDDKGNPVGSPEVTLRTSAETKTFSLYYALTHYFKNGGGPCYVVSVGNYVSPTAKGDFTNGLDALERQDEPTLIVLTDAASVLGATEYYALCSDALAQCKKLGNRFTIVDVLNNDKAPDDFRNNLVSSYLMYGAAYHPYLRTSIGHRYLESGVNVTCSSPAGTKMMTVSLPPAGGNGVTVSYTGSTESAPAVNFTSGSEPLSFSVTGGALTISGPKEATGKGVADAWNAWKKTGKPNGFEVTVAGDGSAKIADKDPQNVPLVVATSITSTLATLKGNSTAMYNRVRAALEDQYVTLPPSAAMAGIYARVDRDQGVWKSPANAAVMAVLGAAKKITDQEQENLNVDPVAGKSINAIRDFTGNGTLVWGGRTLAGNDNEWRYVSVRRLFITIEESCKKASAFAVFEPNDQSTWLKVKAMIESYLYGLWEQGALAGSKPEAAYHVRVGLGTTMTPQDVLEGRMIVKIGVAAVRPAEFIVLEFSHKMQSA